jgi:hypothetical protein
MFWFNVVEPWFLAQPMIKNMRNYIATLREFPNIALFYRSELDDENPSLDMSNIN